MKRRKYIRRSLWALVLVVILMNVVAFNHAYKFTHFDTSRSKTKEATQLSFLQKIEVALWGVNNPRPENKTRPATPYETIRLKSNKEIECWFIKAKEPRGTVAIFHGYGGEKSSMLDKAAIFQSLGYNTLLVDFMGVGGSEGRQTTIGFKEAEQVKTCFTYLQQQKESNIILFGTSLGASAVMKAISDYQLPASSIIIECPFGTMLQTVKNRFSTMGIPSFPMAHLLLFWGGVQNNFNAYSHNPVDYAKKIRCPTLLFYGEKDQKVTKEETESIFRYLPGPKKLVSFPEAGHENYLTKYKDQWTRAISDLLNGNHITGNKKALTNPGFLSLRRL